MNDKYINNYGQHPTIYNDLNDIELYGMYRNDIFHNLDAFERLELMQETINRSAVEKGEIGSCGAHFAELDPNTRADQFADKIRFDVYKFAGNEPSVDSKGNLREISILQNVEALEAALHENEHAWQNQAMAGVIPVNDPYTIYEYRANNFDISQLSNGNYGQHYLGDSILYYLQSTERDAHINSQAKTLEILNMVENAYGKDETFDMYRQVQLFEGYNAQLEEAKNIYNNPAVERDVNQTLINHYYGINIPVDPHIKADVERLMEEGLAQKLNNQNQIESNQLNNNIRTTPNISENVNNNENNINQDNVIDLSYDSNNPDNKEEFQNSNQQEKNESNLNQESTNNINDNSINDSEINDQNNENFSENNTNEDSIVNFTYNSNNENSQVEIQGVDINYSLGNEDNVVNTESEQSNNQENQEQSESLGNNEDNDNSQSVESGIDFY